MTGTWVVGLLRRRGGRLLSVSLGIAVAVALIASLGTFLTTSQATMTARALRSVAVDWLSRPGARCRRYRRSVSPGRSPNPACDSHRTGLSTATAVRRWLAGSRDWGSCCPGSDTG